MSAVAKTLGVSRSNLHERARGFVSITSRRMRARPASAARRSIAASRAVPTPRPRAAGVTKTPSISKTPSSPRRSRTLTTTPLQHAPTHP